MALHRLNSKRSFLAQIFAQMSPARLSGSARKDGFLSPTSTIYIEEMYNAWLRDSRSVHISWDTYFRNINRGLGPGEAYISPPTISPSNAALGRAAFRKQPQSSARAPAAAPTTSTPAMSATSKVHLTERVLDDHLAVQNVIRSYQSRGHLVARCDPLELTHGELHSTFEERRGLPPKRVVREHMLGTSAETLDSVFKLPPTTFIGGRDRELSLRVIIDRLEKAYCDHIGAEFMYISSYSKTQWLREKLETPGIRQISNAEKKLILERLIRGTLFEMFLAKKYVSVKRFGLEGCEVLIPALKCLIDTASDNNTDSFVFGMAHRGRLNVVANVLHQPLHILLAQFSALATEEAGSGDVKYHLGTFIERENTKNGKKVSLSIVANPSHLEVVNPIVMGKTRAEQFFKNDRDGDQVLGVLIHGDAAFCGQGVVFETFHLSHLPNYTTNGTIHIVINNQIGFTTDPRFSRSSPYCTDVARVTQAPIFHVNGDDPEAVMYCVKTAVQFRNRFKKDAVVDIVCYRRNGHNEIDEPSFTQPMMYKKIRSMPNTMDKYAAKLVAEKVVTPEELQAMKDYYETVLEEGFAQAKMQQKIKLRDWVDSPWKGFFPKPPNPPNMEVKPTGVAKDVLIDIATKFSSPPPPALNFEIHKGLDRVLKARMDMVGKQEADWAIGEALAFGTLMKEKIHVRLSGQDVERGTFSHRHHVLHHQSRDKEMYVPMQHLYPDQAVYSVCNSSISEFGVMGFEIGYSMTNPRSLVLWEAQFGDFNNGGQVMIDQFLASGESKWFRQTGMVMLNPHGLEGMGPEHSSARLERFLLLCDDDPDTMPDITDPQFLVKQLKAGNWFVANCTTPANLFHILRRQIALPFRKPLIMMTPKSLLRHPECRSSFDEMVEGTEFKRMIFEDGPASQNPSNVKKLIFCTGKVYYDLIQERKARKLEELIAITRIEQLFPFPYDLLKTEVEKYKQAELCWAQEEHKNQGAWYYIVPRFGTALQECEKDVMTYAGRATSSSPATGSKIQFDSEQASLLELAMQINPSPIKRKDQIS